MAVPTDAPTVTAASVVVGTVAAVEFVAPAAFAAGIELHFAA